MNELTCARCGQPPKFSCERCLEPYCSSQCQVADWQQHKANCYKFPNLIPMHILKSASNLSLKSDSISRRQYGSKDNINDSRRSNTSLNMKSRNPIEGTETSTGAKPKKLLHDEDFTLMPKASLATHTNANVSEAQSVVSAVGSEKSANWQLAYPPPSGFFEAMVQFVEEIERSKRFVWVTEVKYDAPLRKLLAEINRNINQNEPCRPELIFPGALVAAPLNKILYRAQILDCSQEAQRANVRLIDYGNEFRIPYNQIFAPIPIMVNLNAYAIRVCVPNDCGPLELESVFTIKVVGEKHTDGYYNVECKRSSESFQLPVESLTKEGSLSVVKCFIDGRNALLRLNFHEDINLDAMLNSDGYDLDKIPNEGSLIAARVTSGWKRACLLGFFEKDHQFLVYTIDEGFIGLSPQIKRIPDAFLSQPMRVFAVSTSSPDHMLSESMLTTAKKLSLQLLPATSVTAGKDSKTHLSCALFDDTQKIVDVVIASVFKGCLDELGIKLWHERPEAGSVVFVSNVLTFKEIYITSSDTKEYAKIFLSEYSKRSPFGPDDVIKKDDVVFVCDAVGNKYRGQVLKYEGNTYNIINVDNGVVEAVEIKCLFKPTQLIRSLPVRCSLVKLMYLESIPTPMANNKALAALEICMENATEFEVYYGDGGGGGHQATVDLLFRTTERQSLCKKLLPMVFEPRETSSATSNFRNSLPNTTAQLRENAPLPPSPPDTPITLKAVPQPNAAVKTGNVAQKSYSLDDLEIIPIECGEKAELYVLDATTLLNLESPYITAADFKNKQFLSKMEKYLEMVGTYCTGPNAPMAGYAPKKMEICLSIFADDNQWYRALCIDHHPNDMFIVMFLDYGNISKVTKKDIMPITAELLFPSNANMVYVEGITSKDQALKFVKATQEVPIVKAKLVQLPDNDAYLAKVYQLDKIIG